ncbi:MAG: hypothetical protein SGPRY_007705 [Prymnesium sp.]
MERWLVGLALAVGVGLAFRLLLTKLKAEVYDALIIQLTTRWYTAVLNRLKPQDRLLDIGIGTATALARNAHRVLEKKLVVVGIDYEEAYITKAVGVVKAAGLHDSVRLLTKSVYDPQLPVLFSGAARFHAIYFSGSLTLMPQPAAALRAAASMLHDKGRIYVTQTFQNQKSPLTEIIKPLLRWITTIDFGVVTVSARLEMRTMDEIVKSSGLTLLEDAAIPGSIDTSAQTARMYVLEFRADEKRC